jgi:hypothetical protein
MINTDKKKKIFDLAKRTVENYQSGALEAEMGYKFRTRAFLEVIFLYTNSVDVKNPDLLGKNNKNTFVHEAQSVIEKIKEQIRLDIRDINFQVNGASSLGRFIPKAANRKMLEDNNFADDLDEIPDNAADYGSGFLKVWEAEGKMKMRSIDPFFMIFNQYDFKGGPKLERMRKTIRWIIGNEKYDADARAELSAKTADDKLDTEVVFYQMVVDTDEGQEISVVDLERDAVYYTYEHKGKDKIVSYYKFDYQKRKGFPDALGKGCNEKIFNKLVQSKVNRERMDQVLEVASKLPFQKEMDNERDNWTGKEIVKLKTSAIIGHKGNKIEPLDTGGIKQANIITSQLNSIVESIGADLNATEALLGNTLPSGTSGALGNLLTENSSSVFKEIKKNYAKFLSIVYKERLTPYTLKVFDSADNLKDYLDPNDIKLVEQSVIDYLVAQKQIDAAINDLPFDVTLAKEEVKREIKGKALISGELLEQLRNEAQGIKTYITGENVSKAQSVAFIREMRNTFAKQPDLFQSPFFVELLKKEAEYEAGISGIEIDNLLKELQQ